MTVEILLRGGRVCDPESGFDGLADVLVRDDRVAEIGTELPAGDAEVVDVAGTIVGPGFIDLHSHVHSVAGQRLQAFDGVTTSLELEAGLSPVDRAYRDAAAAGRPLNYGFSASWSDVRGEVLLGVPARADPQSDLLGHAGWQRSSTPEELTAWLDLLERELADGALGIGVLMGYAPQTDPAEFLEVARVAARAGAPTFTHVRELSEINPATPIDGASELTRAAAETGAAMHHCHVNSTSRRHMDRVLALIEASRAEGSRVSAEAYPYGSGWTSIGAVFLAPERLPLIGIRASDIVILSTGERIESDARLREIRERDPAAACVFRYFDEDDPADLAFVRRPFEVPDSIVASDAGMLTWGPGSTYDSDEWPLPPGARTHPRTAGTFAKAIRLMVRETGAWSWVEAFRRCSFLAARILEDIAPAMRMKGRVAVGADADLVVLDPDRVTDTATYVDSVRPSQGVRHLLVNGTFLIRDGELRIDARPGRPVRGRPG
jgi:N-acyl-D-aspartate/D-glutamate deacylase